MNDIDDAIGKVETLYRTLTGKDVPIIDVPYAPIPAERDPAQHVQEQIERLSSMLSGTPLGESTLPQRAWMPPVSLWSSRDELLVCVDLPGVPREQLEVDVQGAVVIVSGRRASPAGGDHRIQSSEHPLGEFRRVIALPANVRTDQINAWLKDGVLSLRLPRTSNEPRRTIAIS